MRTGQVASRAGVNTETLRYYERRGLLATPPRRESGYRDYGSDAVGTVRFIRQAQAVGFSLDEVESLIELANGGPESIDAVQELAQRRMAELDRRLADLQAIRTALTQLVDTSDRPRAVRECPLLQIVEVEDERPDH
jgi:DNA-binding transcriptional MerR regulator